MRNRYTSAHAPNAYSDSRKWNATLTLLLSEWSEMRWCTYLNKPSLSICSQFDQVLLVSMGQTLINIGKPAQFSAMLQHVKREGIR